MQRIDHIRLMARYNSWMNERLYAAASSLPDEALSAERNAFFGSILGTLNHLVVADRIWLGRYTFHPASYQALAALDTLKKPERLDQPMAADIRELRALRQRLDACIEALAQEIREEQLDQLLSYRNMKGAEARKNFFALLMHLFNHQTHHRGQVTTLLSQAGVDVGVTDLLMLIPEEL
ncbi:DinB family protein [Pseudomonas berkeleyensis]|uniref:DinB family protein n=1 Tax=Pseudomonas berkeleyensis TaxID=2726956 RepID=A0A7G5DI84_9PSED|nr:DinB family protein [Pseudomonas berkeleyensis]QMV61459.1 DinB family protein [Pseudomonas berkeleyensis]WSO36890.1 DinB family protein [Pseudomonas berkeleyensis]